MGILAGKVTLVTGAGQGIGRAIAEASAREGAKVLVADFNEASGEATATLIRDAGGEATFAFGDVSKEDSVERMVQAAVDTYGRLDCACNSAAVSRGSGPIQDYEREVFDETLEMCLTNTWLSMKHEIPAMLAAGGGSIVNISSNASLRGQPFNGAYAAAKGGVNSLTRSTAAELGKSNIRVNAISPGVVRTPTIEQYLEAQPKIAEGLVKSNVMNRIGEPSEIGEAVVFLLSDRASYITGQLLSVDGGNYIR